MSVTDTQSDVRPHLKPKHFRTFRRKLYRKNNRKHFQNKMYYHVTFDSIAIPHKMCLNTLKIKQIPLTVNAVPLSPYLSARIRLKLCWTFFLFHYGEMQMI